MSRVAGPRFHLKTRDFVRRSTLDPLAGHDHQDFATSDNIVNLRVKRVF